MFIVISPWFLYIAKKEPMDYSCVITTNILVEIIFKGVCYYAICYSIL